MILRYYGNTLPLARLESLLWTDEYGTSLEPIRRLLRQQRLSCRIVAHARLRDPRKVVDAGRPPLISMGEGEQWAVVYGYSPGCFFVGEFSLGAMSCKVPIGRFRGKWDGEG